MKNKALLPILFGFFIMGFGGIIVSAVLGLTQKAFGAAGIVAVLLVCLAYLFALGIFTWRNAK